MSSSVSHVKGSQDPILIVTENLNVGGAEKYTVLVANELHARGRRVVVLANDGPFRKHFHPDIRFVRAFFERGILGVLYGAFQMIRITLQERIPLIHAQKLESSKAAWLARFVTGVPVVKTAHGYTPAELVRLGGVIDKYSDKVVTVVDWLLPELEKNGVQGDKLSVIYNGTSDEPFVQDRERVRREIGLTATDKVVISLSRLERGKNFTALVQWFAGVVALVPEAKLVIVGGGPEKQSLIEEVKESHLDKAIIFVDAKTEIRKYLDIADVFCTPSIGRGMAVLEAMAAGLPVVGFEPIGEPRVVVDGETGYLIQKDDGKTLVEKISHLLRNPDRARKFGEAGRKRARNKFSQRAMVDQLELVYAQTSKKAFPSGLSTRI
ncbi:MAG: glycosyltransferase family 4 protein [Candidatus Pacebacteria bacterium]|nr:glycosyltransferase family 4 protein [Candidatus Paceibacterota bacterium]